MSIFQNIRAIALALVFSLIMVGCSPAAPTATPVPATDVTFQMSWIHEYSAAGLYLAEMNNHFADENLNVKLEVGGFVDGHYIEPIDKVISHEVDFGLSSAAAILQARADGKPVVAIASILQRNPTALIFLASSNIQQPTDLIGKTVAVSDGGAAQLLNVMLTSQGIDLSQVNIIPRTDFGIGTLMDGSVDALVGWIINEGVAVKEAGAEPGFMLLSDYGIPDYATLIFTSEDMIKSKPDIVQRFVRGVVAGWDDVVKDPEAAVTGVLKYNDQLNRTEQLSRVQASIPLLQPARTKIGLMDKDTWENIYKVLKNAGVITADVDINTVFNTSFLDKIYAQ
jgi:ABC-type nitrate/sulfonate/bicarbonate transport system substrate-binding protein